MSGFRNDIQRFTAKQLRSQMTPAQKLLWAQLRAHRFHGLSIRRQAPIGPYIVDFLVPAERLALIIGNSATDYQRDAYLETRGYRILRVGYHEVLAQLPAVLALLSKELQP